MRGVGTLAAAVDLRPRRIVRVNGLDDRFRPITRRTLAGGQHLVELVHNERLAPTRRSLQRHPTRYTESRHLIETLQ